MVWELTCSRSSLHVPTLLCRLTGFNFVNSQIKPEGFLALYTCSNDSSVCTLPDTRYSIQSLLLHHALKQGMSAQRQRGMWDCHLSWWSPVPRLKSPQSLVHELLALISQTKFGRVNNQLVLPRPAKTKLGYRWASLHCSLQHLW